MKSILTAIAVAGIMSFAAAGAQAASTFNLGGSYTGGTNSLSYSEDGINLTVDALHSLSNGSIHDNNEKITRTSNGVGVDSAGDSTDLADGEGSWNDLVRLQFDQAVKLIQVTFSYYDDETQRERVRVCNQYYCYYTYQNVPAGDDEFAFFADTDSDGFERKASNVDGNPYVFAQDWISQTFGFGAEGRDDEWRVASVTVAAISAVPLPAALPLYGAGLAVMGFVGWRKRRKAAAQA
ncbi:MAG: hypothetical protein COB93_01105 [Sneathiella sp.]|nr:MAG: hypothetical protein COB93_01105 [Sneathiella sp.]